MKLISWNVRGMDSDSKRSMIKGVIKSAIGEFLLLWETKMEVIDAQMVRSICTFHNPSYVFRPSEGMSGGILLL